MLMPAIRQGPAGSGVLYALAQHRQGRRTSSFTGEQLTKIDGRVGGKGRSVSCLQRFVFSPKKKVTLPVEVRKHDGVCFNLFFLVFILRFYSYRLILSRCFPRTGFLEVSGGWRIHKRTATQYRSARQRRSTRLKIILTFDSF